MFRSWLGSAATQAVGLVGPLAERIVDDAPDKIPEGLITYAEECAVEHMTQNLIREEFDTKYTIHGHEKEVPTMMAFMEETGIEAYNFGDDQEFITPNRTLYVEGYGEVNLGDHVGCTPDGLIGLKGGVEGKARSSKEHFKRLKSIFTQEDLLTHDKYVYWQIMFSLWVTGRQSWYLVMFDDRFTEDFKHLRMRIVRVDRNEDHISKLEERVKLAIKFKLDQIARAVELAG